MFSALIDCAVDPQPQLVKRQAGELEGAAEVPAGQTQADGAQLCRRGAAYRPKKSAVASVARRKASTPSIFLTTA